MIELILQDLAVTVPGARDLVRVVVRLLAALAVGALVGYQRERMGKAAGLRTHMLVSMGTTLVVVSALESGMDDDGLSRIIQGLITGIGFLGAGAIMKIQTDRQIRGLTTAAGIWMTAATSVAIGLGQIGIGVIAGLLTWLVLDLLHRITPDRPGRTPRGDNQP